MVDFLNKLIASHVGKDGRRNFLGINQPIFDEFNSEMFKTMLLIQKNKLFYVTNLIEILIGYNVNFS